MKKEILHELALNANGSIIKAKNAQKGEKYFCPVCKSDLILKKSGNTGKGSKRPHFAHYTLTENCTNESILHYSFKIMLLAKIQDNLTKGLPMLLLGKCNHCNGITRANLLQGVVVIKDEYDMKICRPDLALIDDKGKVCYAIEIVVTHHPEDTAIKYYKQNEILLIKIFVKSEVDLEMIEHNVVIASDFDYCFNPNCSHFIGGHRPTPQQISLERWLYKRTPRRTKRL